LVPEVERNLRNLDEVTRYLSVKVADEIDPEARPALEDLRLAGDMEDGRGAGPDRERTGEAPEEPIAELDEEPLEEA
jgi:small subunit ribosomal protein S6